MRAFGRPIPSLFGGSTKAATKASDFAADLLQKQQIAA
jgi:hypothetical protein